jgi:hypothetical protein
MTIELDEEAVELIEEYKVYEGDESFASHLAAKILNLYEEQL